VNVSKEIPSDNVAQRVDNISSHFGVAVEPKVHQRCPGRSNQATYVSRSLLQVEKFSEKIGVFDSKQN
jgi:hypothetical protein